MLHSQHPNGAEPKDEAEVTVRPFAGMLSRPVTPNTTRREYALLELLRSERTYVSDLTLLRDYQIPLALGRLSSMSSIWPAVDATICQYLGLEPAACDTDVGPAAPQGCSSVAPRRTTTASNLSSVSFGSIFTLRPMKTKDVNIVFSNIEELAAFTEEFLDRLESALGELIEGNEGEDSVGRLFLEVAPRMVSLYKTYIMNQPHALEHYHRLSKTFQFDVYFPRSQILAHKASNARDLPSLLIKPVQRLLHYPELIAAIIAETPDSHSDKANLVEAHARIVEMARGLNEQWRQRLRQQKIVQEALAVAGLVDTPPAGGESVRPRKKNGLRTGLAASITLGRIMGSRPGADKAREGPEVDAEPKAVKVGGERLKEYGKFMGTFAGETVNWVDAMHNLVGALQDWALCLAKVVLIDPEEECPEALQMFLTFVGDLWPLVGDQLQAEIGEALLRTINSLKDTIAAPLCLLEEMQRLEPLHYDLLNLNVAKSRPPPSLLDASRSYMALRELLFDQLPRYLALLDKGMAACILKFAHIQQQFYEKMRDLCGEMWDAMAAEGETNGGAAETLRTWSRRFSEVDEGLTRLNIPWPLVEEPATRTWSLDRSKRRLVASADACLVDDIDVSTKRSILRIPVMYRCRVTQSCQMPPHIRYRNLPCFTLVVGEVYDVLAEADPSTHPYLPVSMRSRGGEECLLFVRNRSGKFGWASDYFMVSLDE